MNKYWCRISYWLWSKLIFTCPTTDGRRFVLHLIPSWGQRGGKDWYQVPITYQKCIMWDYYYWYPNDADAMGCCVNGIFSIGIPFTKRRII